MHGTDRDVRRAVHDLDGEGDARDDRPAPRIYRGGRDRGGPPARGVSGIAARIAALLALLAALGAVVYVARGLVPEAEAPAADPHGPRVRVVIPPGSDGE